MKRGQEPPTHSFIFTEEGDVGLSAARKALRSRFHPVRVAKRSLKRANWRLDCVLSSSDRVFIQTNIITTIRVALLLCLPHHVTVDLLLSLEQSIVPVRPYRNRSFHLRPGLSRGVFRSFSRRKFCAPYFIFLTSLSGLRSGCVQTADRVRSDAPAQPITIQKALSCLGLG